MEAAKKKSKGGKYDEKIKINASSFEEVIKSMVADNPKPKAKKRC